MALFGSGKADLIAGLSKARAGFLGRLQSAFGLARRVDPAALEDLEAVLLAADCGPAATSGILSAVSKAYEGKETALEDLKGLLRRELAGRLGEGSPLAFAAQAPTVVLVVGVNGSGKTTTVAKLARRLSGEGRSVIVAAADTFRAAAVEQISAWCERLGIPCVRGGANADPAAVAFDAAEAARARSIDVVLVDTAGRLHTHDPLMRELSKISRVAAKAVDGAPHEVLLVLDATAGQNALAQARQFAKAARLTGLVLAKMDGTAKGGIVLAIRKELGLPVKFVGTGEGPDDLAVFDPSLYVQGLLGP